MSPVPAKEFVDARRYGGVNGNEIIFTEKKTGGNDKVIEYILRNDSHLSIKRNLFFFCVALFLSNLTNSYTLVIISVAALTFQCKRIATSVDFDTLLVVDSVGVQITSKKIFSGFNSSQFLPWTTVEDVFINEVITGGIETFEGMPGIHVRGIGKADKARELQTLPNLNVPGSYWLSHKRNIYKFTFKYREATTRNNEEFLHKDELLRVIRQIIKCQPSQGQLNTIHLSIAYKHTFWTRQDKMFAMLKFHNKDGAAAFSQAFILTISLKDSAVSNEQFTSTITQPDLDLCDDVDAIPKTGTNSPHSASKRSSDKNDLTRLHPFSNVEDDLVDENPTTITNTAMIQSSFGPQSVIDMDFGEPESSKKVTTKRRSTSRMQRRDNRLSLPSEMTKRYELTDLVVKKCGESPSAVDERRNSDRCKYQSDSASMNVEKVKGDGRAEKAAVAPEPVIPPSSDITEQVMEGLMFTIKQDEDNIKVLEQKTKMELDEVLENSEKIETKEGEKCLVNSSLLGLENLLTKIEVPNKQIKDNRTTKSSYKIDEKISSIPTLVRDQDGIFAAGFSSFRSREKAVGPISRTDLILARSSLESNGNNNVVVNESNPLTNGSVSNQLLKPKLLRRGGDKEVIRRFHQNVIEPKRRKLALGKINSEINRSPKDIGKTEIANNRTGNISNGNTEDNVGDDNNNNNNSNSKNNGNGTGSVIANEVQINMWKLLQDIARGVKVMVERISDTDIKNATRSQTISTSATGTMARRVPTRSTK